MKLKCDITMDDLLVGLRHLVETSPVIKSQQLRRRLVAIPLPTALFGLLDWARHELGFVWAGLVMSMVCVVIIGPLQRRTMLRHSRRMYEQSGGKFLGPRELSIEDRGLHSISRFEEKTIFWDSISNVTVSDDHCLVCVSNLAVLAIPKDRILSGDFDTFTQALIESWQKATT